MPYRPHTPKPKPSAPHGDNKIWGAYKPSIVSTYPDLPVKGRIVNTQRGREFRPDPRQVDRRHHVDHTIRNWITGSNYDLVVQAMRELADKTIQDMKSGIARLDRFIENN